MAGLPRDKQNIDAVIGDLALQLNRWMRRAGQFKIEIDAYSDAQLTAAGFSAGEITTLRAFAADADQLATLYRGGVALPVVKDFRPTARPLWGVLGDI